MPPLLSVRGLTLRRDDGTGSAIISDLDLDVDEGEIVIVTGESGSGKTTLLKCIAELNVYQGGEVRLHGKLAKDYGVPRYRTLVQYVPQRPSLLPGTPLDFLGEIKTFAARRAASAAANAPAVDPLELAAGWGVDKVLWTREWATLSGGEGQRIALAIALAVGGADVVLLDEPTSALDEATMQQVEKGLVGMMSSRTSDGTGPKAYLWITHAPEQAKRVGTKTIDITRR